MQRRTLAVCVVLAALAGLGIGCATNPVTGKREFSLVTEAQLNSIGRDGYAAIASEYGLYQDPKIVAFVDTVGMRVCRVSHLPEGPWKITVLDDPIVNAFAMPGGYLYVSRGIIAHLGSEAQLAGVLGHEAGHVTGRHTASRMTQQQLAGLGLGLASIMSRHARQYSEAAQQALGLMFLKYGRDDENESDALGVQYATAAGYDPREIPHTYVMLGRIGDRAGQKLPSYMSTHPDPGDRQVRTTELSNTAAAGKTGLRIEQRSYLARLEGLPFGQDPRNGFFEGTTFYHPELAVQIGFPTGWKTQNTQAAVAAADPNQKAVMQLRMANDASAPKAYVQKLLSEGKIAQADGKDETIGGWPAWVGAVAIQQEGGQPVRLVASWVRQSPERMYEMLAQTPGAGTAEEAAILTAMRSLRPLTDAARLAATADKVTIVKATKSGAFSEVFPSLGASAIKVEDAAILNNVDLDQEVRSGETIKMVRPGKRK